MLKKSGNEETSLKSHFCRQLFGSTNTGKGGEMPSRQDPLSFSSQPGVKNELFNSKQAVSWPFVCFDLRIRSLHECLYCHVAAREC